MPVPVISIDQMREWEKATWSSGQSEAEVIRRVGRVIAGIAMRSTSAGDLILIAAGKGHNGDDARCAREFLADRRVELLEVKNPELDFSKLDALLSMNPSLVIDGLFGIGLNRPLEGAWVPFIERLNAAERRVLAVDVPSGLNADTGEPQGAAVEATLTLTVGAPKIGMLKQQAARYVGRLEVATDVGLIPCPLSSELLWTLPEDFVEFPPRRTAASHKGTYGHLGILAGSMGYHGASVLAARGAQRSRPGLITLFTHESAYTPAAAQLQAVMVQSWSPETHLLDDFDALLIGPGLASPLVPEEMKAAARRLWKNAEGPVVVDASALDWLPAGPVLRNSIRVLTPHPGEAARLLKTTPAQVLADRPQALRELSRHFGHCWVVLKGNQTLVGRCPLEGAGVEPLFVNSSGNPFLAQGGSGDVLGGLLAGLLTQPALQSDPGKTIRYGVWRHGAAADMLCGSRPNWVVEDLVEAL